MPLILTLSPARGAGARETRTVTDGTLSIGRGPGNDWVLPDPDRLLSKTHCRISVEGSRYVLTDTSTNGVFLNGSRDSTGRDSRVILRDGDQFRLGDYNVEVAEAEHAPSPRPDRGAPASPFGAASFATAGNQPDPFGGEGLDDPFGEPGTMFRHPVAQAAPVFRQADPFDRAGGAQNRSADPDDDLFRGITPVDAWKGPSQADNVDAPKQAYQAPKPLPPVRHGEIDFDALLGDDPIGGAAFPMPPKAAPVTPPPAERSAPKDDLDDFLGPDTAGFGSAAAPPVADPWQEPVQPALPPPARVQPAPAEAAPAPPPSGDTGAPLAAFLDAAGIGGMKLPAQDPEAAMREAGIVFRALVEGLREVLMSRAAIKNELRVEQTMLRARDNNALKFSVTPEEAIAALLMPGRPGYRPPLAAVREAYKDIQSHEMAVMAGVQTALIGLLKRFDPVALEARLQPGRLDSLLPGARKAKIWELFCATYKDIAREAEDDFQSVFGREFARAYDAQMKKL